MSSVTLNTPEVTKLSWKSVVSGTGRELGSAGLSASWTPWAAQALGLDPAWVVALSTPCSPSALPWQEQMLFSESLLNPFFSRLSQSPPFAGGGSHGGPALPSSWAPTP